MYPQACAKDSNDIERDSDVSLEIPSGTVIAYSILELEIKKNGHYGEYVCVCICVFVCSCACVLVVTQETWY